MTAPCTHAPSTITSAANPVAETQRLFFALWPDESLAAMLHQSARLLAAKTEGRCMTQNSLHMTLAFLGEIAQSRIPQLLDVAKTLREAPFELVLDRIDYWPHNRIVWAGCSQVPPPLQQLAGNLQNALRQAGFAIEPRPFMPHVTLLRNCRQDMRSPLSPLPWPVRSFVLVESHPGAEAMGGARYVPVGRWPLLG